MRKMLVILAVLAAAAPVLAAQLAVGAPQPLGTSPAVRGTSVYANTTTVVTGWYDNDYGTGAQHEFGDRVTATAGGIVDEVTFSVFNYDATTHNPPLPLDSADLTVRFYNMVANVPVYAGGVVFSAVPLNLPSGYYTSLASGDGLSIYNISVGTDVLMTLQISNTTGGSFGYGQVAADPPTIGSSNNDEFWEDGVFYSGFAPNANLYYEYSVVPEPAALAILAFGALLLRRR